MDPRIRHRNSFPLSREESKARLLSLQCRMLEFDTCPTTYTEVGSGLGDTTVYTKVSGMTNIPMRPSQPSQTQHPQQKMSASSAQFVSVLAVAIGAFLLGCFLYSQIHIGQQMQSSVPYDDSFTFVEQPTKYMPFDMNLVQDVMFGHQPASQEEALLKVSETLHVDSIDEMLNVRRPAFTLNSGTPFYDAINVALQDGDGASEKMLAMSVHADEQEHEKSEAGLLNPTEHLEFDFVKSPRLCVASMLLAAAKSAPQCRLWDIRVAVLIGISFCIYLLMRRRMRVVSLQGPVLSSQFAEEPQTSLKAFKKYVWTQKGIEYLKSQSVWKAWAESGKPGPFPIERGMVNEKLLHKVFGNEVSGGEIDTLLDLNHIVEVGTDENQCSNGMSASLQRNDAALSRKKAKRKLDSPQEFHMKKLRS